MSDMQRPVLSFAAGYHLRAKPLCDGRVKMENFELKAVAFEEDGKGHEEFLAGKYDTGEFSLANYLALKSRGEPLMAIPVFPNRKFRHSYIFVREDSPLKEPAQLKGKRVGIPGWLNTAGLWARGILSDEYGVKAQDIHWIARRKAPLGSVFAGGNTTRRGAGRRFAGGAAAQGGVRRHHRSGLSGRGRSATTFCRLESRRAGFLSSDGDISNQPRDYLPQSLFGQISSGGDGNVHCLL